MMFEELPALNILQFFSQEVDCFYVPQSKEVFHKKYLLASTSQFLDEEEFARVYIGWNESCIKMHFEVFILFEKAFYTEYRRGDSIELFFDTRDLKDQSFMTQFCHHFVFYPEKIKNIQGREVTRFRSDEVHVLCDAEDLEIQANYAKASYTLQVNIPVHCLHGFDPKNFKRLGFCYQINRLKNPPQHFCLSSLEYKIEQNPSLWATLCLVDKGR